MPPMATPMSKVAEESLATTSMDRMLQFSPWHNLCIYRMDDYAADDDDEFAALRQARLAFTTWE